MELLNATKMQAAYTMGTGFSSPRYEVDFALRKSKCDVLLNATAYAPHELVRPN